jgi:hypothetical protein
VIIDYDATLLPITAFHRVRQQAVVYAPRNSISVVRRSSFRHLKADIVDQNQRIDRPLTTDPRHGRS